MEFRRLLLNLVIIGACLGLMGISASLLYGREILTLLYGSTYAGYNKLFVWVMIAGAVIFIQTALGFAYTTIRQFRVLIIPHIIVTIIMFASSFLLVSVNGSIGGAWAFAFSNLCLVFLFVFLLNRALASSPSYV